jgi:hypothetical protein
MPLIAASVYILYIKKGPLINPENQKSVETPAVADTDLVGSRFLKMDLPSDVR